MQIAMKIGSKTGHNFLMIYRVAIWHDLNDFYTELIPTEVPKLSAE